MKTLMLAVLSLLLSVFLFSSTYSEEEWKKKLIADGWEWVDMSKNDIRDTTFYFAKEWAEVNNFSYDHPNIVIYISKDGKLNKVQLTRGLETHTLTRRVTSDGKVCVKYRKWYGDREQCRTLWRKGNVNLFMSFIGTRVGAFIGTKGNVENL